MIGNYNAKPTFLDINLIILTRIKSIAWNKTVKRRNKFKRKPFKSQTELLN